MSGGEVPALELRRVSRSFGAFRAVGDVSLSIPRSERHALIGPNGAGKTTLLNVATGAIPPSAGEIRLDGKSIAGIAPYRLVHAGIARSFQITSIFPRLSVAENVRVALLARHGLCRRVFGFASRLLNDQVARLLEQVHMSQAFHRIAGELAAGDRKRLEFAIALAGDPRVMLLDEPTAGMSAAERTLVTQVVRSLNEEHGVTVLFTEHDIDMVFSLAHRITVLHQGSVVAQGTPSEIRSDERVRSIYLGEHVHA
jgi:branched-chain amino acid transport system ATP-binding protein